MKKSPVASLVPNPCHEDWGQMSPNERGNFCRVCTTQVHDLGQLTHAEAEALLSERGEHLCVSYNETDDGSVRFKDGNLVPLARLVRKLPRVAGLTLALAACDPGNNAQVDKPKPATQAATGPTGPTGPTGAAEVDDPETMPHVVGKYEIDDPAEGGEDDGAGEQPKLDAGTPKADPPPPKVDDERPHKVGMVAKPEKPTRKGKVKLPEGGL